jgi:hypothetical protein
MATTSDRMQIPEYVKRELSEVYLLMDHIAGRKDKTLDEALAPPTTAGLQVTLEEVCGVAWPPTDQNRAKTLALVLTAKDRLSRAAFPATGYSVAFTYLSLAKYIDAARGSPRQRWFAWLSGAALHMNGLDNVTHLKPSDAGAMSDAIGEGVAGTPVPDSSAMVQFAKDAFPRLEFARESPFCKSNWLIFVLLILLAVTCAVSWDLAVGQRLLADYRWLSSHPQALQFDEKQPSCTAFVSDPSKIEPGDRCARALAFERVRPLANSWIGWQFPLRSFIHVETVPAPNDKEVSYQGYVLEQTRVLVTTLNYNVLPLFLGALAASAAALRSIATKIAGHELEPRDLAQVWPRVLLGAFLGSMIGLFIAPGQSNDLFALVAADDATNKVALSPAAYAFLAGFATGRIFHWLDNLIERIFAFANPKP